MSRASKSHRFGQPLLLILIGVLSALFGGHLLANDGASLHVGKELFEREWVHAPPVTPDRGETDRNEYEARLTQLPGDGLGPMYNATSCESCHVGGGGAGVDHNVTLLTLDPRNNFNGPQGK